MSTKLILEDDYEGDSITIIPVSDEAEGTERFRKLPKDAQLIVAEPGDGYIHKRIHVHTHIPYNLFY